MAKELATVRESINLLPREVLDRAEVFLREQGYDVVHRILTSLTAERMLFNSAGGQDKRTVTILVLPERKGGLRLKVLGNDIDGVREQQAHWVEWSESLPKWNRREPRSQGRRKKSAHGSEESLAAALKEWVPTFYSKITVAHKTIKPSKTVAGGAEVLSIELRDLVQQHKSDGENIQFCLLSGNGGGNQAIVALTDRLLMIKPGLMVATASGPQVTSFYYRDITDIEVHTGLIDGVIEINTPSYPRTKQTDFWKIKNEDRDAFRVANCLPISKKNLREYKPYIDRLRAMERAAKQKRVISSPPKRESSLNSELSSLASIRASGVLSELEKLASLRASGVLTEEEFQRAKKRLLG